MLRAALAALALLLAAAPLWASEIDAKGDGPHDVSGTIALPVPEVAHLTVPRAESEMLAAVNAERAKYSLPPLVLDYKLTEVARGYASQMLDQRFFGHIAPSGFSPLDRLKASGYIFTVVGENIAFGNSGAAVAMHYLLLSPRHHAVMIDPRFRKIGIGAVAASLYGTMYVQEFADE